jgi:hypothetical protein
LPEPPGIPDTLREEVHGGRALLFAGAGLSALSGAPRWSELLEILVRKAKAEERLEEPLDRTLALARGSVEQKLALGQWLRETLKRQFEDTLREELARYDPSDLHRELVRLDWVGYVTTNFDTLIEDAYYEVRREPLEVVTWDDPDRLSRLDELEAWIIKVHGSLDSSKSVVLDQRSLDRLVEDEAASQTLRTIFQRRSCLFVGYGLGDTDVTNELRRLTEFFGRFAQPHYVLLPEGGSTVWGRHLLERYNTQSISYPLKNEDHEPGIAAVVDALADPADTSLRKKLLFVVKAVGEPGDEGDAPHLLVTTQVEQWGVEEEGAESDRALDKAFLLPSVDDLGQSKAGAARTFAEATAVNPQKVRVTGEHAFRSTKRDPRINEDAEFAFRFATVELVERDASLGRREPIFEGRRCTWQPFNELKQHAPTLELNHDVLDELMREYGDDLERLEPTLPTEAGG